MAEQNFIIKAIFSAIDRITGPTKAMGRGIASFTAAAGKHIGGIAKVTNRVAHGMERAFKRSFQIAAAGAAALGAALWKVASSGMEFETAVLSAGTKFGRGIGYGTAAYKELEKAARDAALVAGVSASEAALGLKDLGAAGFNMAESVAALPHVLMLAQAAEVSVAEAANMAVSSMGALGLEAKTPEEQISNLIMVMERMKFASDATVLDLADIAEGFIKAGPIAKQYKEDLDDMNAALLVMQQAGARADVAATSYKTVMLSLTNLTPKATKALKDLEIQLVENESGDITNLVNVVDAIDNATKKMGTAESNSLLNMVFGTYGITGFSNMIQAGADRMLYLKGKSKEAMGGIKDSSDQMKTGMAFSVNQMSSELDGLKLDLYNVIRGPLYEGVQWLKNYISEHKTDIIKGFGDALKWVQENGAQVVETIKAFAIAIGIMYAIAKAIAAVNAVFTLFNLIAAANPVVLIIMAIIVAVGALVGVIWYYWDEISGFFQGIADFFSEMFSSPMKAIEGLWYLLKHVIAAVGWLMNAGDGFNATLGLDNNPFKKDENSKPSPGAAPVTPSGRASSETNPYAPKNQTSINGEIAIRDYTGKASYSGTPLKGTGMSFEMPSTGSI